MVCCGVAFDYFAAPKNPVVDENILKCRNAIRIVREKALAEGKLSKDEKYIIFTFDACLPEHSGKGLINKIHFEEIKRAFELGYKYIIVEATHPKTHRMAEVIGCEFLLNMSFTEFDVDQEKLKEVLSWDWSNIAPSIGLYIGTLGFAIGENPPARL